jgi:cupin 2 domain-containing protein
MIAPRNLFADVPAPSHGGEVFDMLLETGHVRIQRIVSHAATSPEGFWYDQEEDEWILVLQGEATLQIHPDSRVHLRTGDCLLIPKRCKHRVESTSPKTVWLAVHLPPAAV